ncbi:MAG TPA: NAD(P)H-dependent oxidoreductase [Smithellaceae bacterium]|jgi:glutathione-regulated potassium-efflux system ancillary protein KefG|nr:NAD(P)H oxidoreductase [Smithella sp.]HOG82302.1 NAD(P)H-dependent oxidoreductase [Smithellaceae bacterium]HOQ41835.1 NAD(P)H-dependent oxidoreductase [Smithellaceae bacterium]HPL66447.1 NAD(P)H-dependent oxidoreductase [Smithellaceae bacterium]HRY36002.1 NAD(P)H-dependent oxidoreductase [Smithellaceae bacterium]
MKKILILFSHPRFEKSRINRVLLEGIDQIEGVRIHDLYEEYPDFIINADREKEFLEGHQIIVWHFPFYTYSAPALLKQWMDIVLEYGWAHGSKGNALKDKIAFVTLTAGGTRESYAANQHNQFTVREFLRPFEQAANLCQMKYLPPFAVHGTHRLTPQQLAAYSDLYRRLLTKLAAGEFDIASICRCEYLNDWLSNKG